MSPEESKFIQWQISLPLPKLAATVVSAALIEEFVFRYIPLHVAGSYFPNHLLLTLIVSSAAFGALHLPNGIKIVDAAAVALLGGIGHGLVFLYCGGWTAHYLRALLASTTTHSCWNFGIFLVVRFFRLK